MAYYTALANEWATLTGTTAQKLAAINALTVTGVVPSTFYVTGAQILNCTNYGEFKLLTAAQQSSWLQLCATQGSIQGGASSFAGGMAVAFFTNLSGPTITAMTALAQAIVTPWWQANGYTSPIGPNDLVAAGNLT